MEIRKTLKITAENQELAELKPKFENKTQNGIRENPKNLLIVKRFFGFWSFKNRLLNQKVSVAIIFEFPWEFKYYGQQCIKLIAKAVASSTIADFI